MASGIVRRDSHGVTVNGWYLQPSRNMGQLAPQPTNRVTWKLEVVNGSLSFIKLNWERERLLCKEKRKSGMIYTKMRTFYNIKSDTMVENFIIENWAYLWNPEICQWFQWGDIRIWRDGNISIHRRKFGQKNIDSIIGNWGTEYKKRVYKRNLPCKYTSGKKAESKPIRHFVFNLTVDHKQLGKDHNIILRSPRGLLTEFGKKFYNHNVEYIERWRN